MYLGRWPDLCTVEESPSGRMMGYGTPRAAPTRSTPQHARLAVIGKAEGQGPEWHGHVTAITVATEYRRLGLAKKMMRQLETISDEVYKGFFVDLYVRCANHVAINMYEGMGYSVYRRVREYYGSLGAGKGGKDEEDAFDMRKPLSRDPQRRSVRENGRLMVVPAHEVP
ncbi:Nat5-prov protein [Coprinopsis cinerea okayama7|uniref:Nat5-prov protein n=1 Tax=Coprinopsis cinerea (strain Okayama-7 / 130 / ATCC MYA-4618 / FGSC 9003) TaxID=240176 RepID=A8NDU6_COPC7|nr:Nat5-prov protein [Coprinopsis cinerea okayama7\|eukprot:XP_001832867.2 Nat5-prov protein [Coprinopsis cinerea okayama7\